MKSAVVRRAKLARILGFALMLAGLAPIVWLAIHAVHPMPAEPWAPLRRLPSIAYLSLVALAVSLPGFVVMWLGATLAARQRDVLDANRRQAADRQRRLREYGRSGERIEPFIGSPIRLAEDKEPF